LLILFKPYFKEIEVFNLFEWTLEFQVDSLMIMLPVMTYGTETWPLIRSLNVTHREMERAMFGFFYVIESEMMRSVKEIRSLT
jgi:hypothetical protein